MDELTVVGHIAVDRIITPSDSRTQLGGPPTYVSLIARRLGPNVKAATKVGEDLPNTFLRQIRELGIDLRGQVVEGAATTRFVLDYRGAERRLSVESVCEEIEPGDLREPVGAVLVAPIVGEVPPAAVLTLTGAELVALDPQGFVRKVREDGSVGPRRWFDEDLLRRVTVYKSSEDELRLVTGINDPWRGLGRILELGAEVAIATRGARGSLLLTREGRCVIPVYGSEAVDPTGAGDVFIGAFLTEYLRGEEPLWCASMAAAAASAVVETFGADIALSMRRLRGRAEEVYDGVVRL